MRKQHTREALVLALASTLAVLVLNGVAILGERVGPASGTGRPAPAGTTAGSASSSAPASAPASASGTGSASPTPSLPGGRSTVFGGHRFLVAYYGTAGTGALGVLGATSPATMQRQLARAGRAFQRPGRPVQLVYELIVSLADRAPGPDGDYSHDLARIQVAPYLEAAHRNGALLLLDLQTGHSDFLSVAKRWRWALEDPSVGLALDPEWRMWHGAVPGHVIGHVGAAEVNRTSAWLSRLVERRHLPEKLFVLHQFRTAMITHIERIRHRPGLAMVQHVDGFGTPGEKRATFHAVVRPGRFVLGFKLFYRADVHRMSAAQVFGLRPTVRFVSFQ